MNEKLFTPALSNCSPINRSCHLLLLSVIVISNVPYKNVRSMRMGNAFTPRVLSQCAFPKLPSTNNMLND